MNNRIRIDLRKNLTVISGPPASGKTTALQQMTNQARNNGRKVTSVSWPSTKGGIKHIIADHQPDYVTIDGDDQEDGLLATASQLAHELPGIHFIITTAE